MYVCRSLCLSVGEKDWRRTGATYCMQQREPTAEQCAINVSACYCHLRRYHFVTIIVDSTYYVYSSKSSSTDCCSIYTATFFCSALSYTDWRKYHHHHQLYFLQFFSGLTLHPMDWKHVGKKHKGRKQNTTTADVIYSSERNIESPHIIFLFWIPCSMCSVFSRLSKR